VSGGRNGSRERGLDERDRDGSQGWVGAVMVERDEPRPRLSWRCPPAGPPPLARGPRASRRQTPRLVGSTSHNHNPHIVAAMSDKEAVRLAHHIILDHFGPLVAVSSRP
jgi:hypothetical protein